MTGSFPVIAEHFGLEMVGVSDCDPEKFHHQVPAIHANLVRQQKTTVVASHTEHHYFTPPCSHFASFYTKEIAFGSSRHKSSLI